MSLTQYWKLRFRSAQPEDDLALLLADGATGGETLADELHCYFEGTEDEAARFVSRNSSHRISLIERTKLPSQNWVASSSAVWERTSAGRLLIVPVQEEENPSLREQGDNTIFIVPGMGFGTGQHDSTKLALELMQHPAVDDVPPAEALDVGTGSGILAIGLHKLYKGRITAFDNDPLAMFNAKRNFQINQTPDDLLIAGELNCIRPSCRFDFIAANIYAEVLCDLESELRSRLNPGGIAVLSGIRNDKASLVRETFETGGWELFESKNTENWTAMLFGSGYRRDGK